VKQFHYTQWPDEGIPGDPQELVNFIQFVNQQVPEKEGPHRPLVIHCRYILSGVSPCLWSLSPKSINNNNISIYSQTDKMQ